jgi:hypothetical protein
MFILDDFLYSFRTKPMTSLENLANTTSVYPQIPGFTSLPQSRLRERPVALVPSDQEAREHGIFARMQNALTSLYGFIMEEDSPTFTNELSRVDLVCLGKIFIAACIIQSTIPTEN